MLDGAFTRGTTPTHIYPIPEPLIREDLAEISITYRQKGRAVLIKRESDLCELEDVDNQKNITLVLSQEDTLLFDPRIKIVEVQVKVETIGSDVFTIGNYRLRLDDIYDSNVFDLD